MTNKDLNKVLKFIEENIRVTDQTTIEYLDPKGHIERLNSKQNQVIFGRRGSGKSLLLKSLKETKPGIICSSINLEDFKDISFPNSIIQVLKTLVYQLNNEVKGTFSFFSDFKKWNRSRNIRKGYTKLLKSLQERLNQPDTFDESIKEKKGSKLGGKYMFGYGTATDSLNSELTKEIETSKSFKIDKHLYKKLFNY